MLDVKKMIQSAEEALGWPYVSPGSNDRNGIDCSGLFVKIFRDQGSNIAHGSNTIWRKYCYDKGPLTSISQLEPGMAVFKHKDQDTAKYPDGQGDFCHIGLVVSVNPLKIIHASSDKGCVTTDTKLGKWSYCGKLLGVDYAGGGGSVDPEPGPEPAPAPEPVGPVYATVWAASGQTVNLRKEKSMSSKLLARMPIGTKVRVIRQGDTWCNVAYTDSYPATWQGYVKTEFLKFDQEDDRQPDIPDTQPAMGVTVIIQGLSEDEADKLLCQYPQGIKTYG